MPVLAMGIVVVLSGLGNYVASRLRGKTLEEKRAPKVGFVTTPGTRISSIWALSGIPLILAGILYLLVK